MLRDTWGSDYDYDAAHGNEDSLWNVDRSREDWCEEHQQRQTTCGPCHTAGALNEDGELVRAVTAHLSKMSVKGAA